MHSLSSRLGAGSPEGWLWRKIRAAELSRTAGAKTSRGCTTLVERLPTETRTSRISRFLAFRCSETKCSLWTEK